MAYIHQFLGWFAGLFNVVVMLFSSIADFFNFVWDWMTNGIYDFAQSFLVVLTKAAIYSYFQITLFTFDIAYTVVQEIMQDVGIVDLVKSAYSSIPGDVQSMLSFFNVPQGLTLIFSAIPTRWTMKFIPGLGK